MALGDVDMEIAPDWKRALGGLEAFEDVEFAPDLVRDLERMAAAVRRRPITFSMPSFKSYDTAEVKGCSKNSFPAFSVTGGACALDCDHCQAKILEPMIPATTPEMLDRKVRDLVLMQDLRGFLLSGGSNVATRSNTRNSCR